MATSETLDHQPPSRNTSGKNKPLRLDLTIPAVVATSIIRSKNKRFDRDFPANITSFERMRSSPNPLFCQRMIEVATTGHPMQELLPSASLLLPFFRCSLYSPLLRA